MGDTSDFVKRVDVDRVEAERARTRIARDVGLESGLFYVPDVREDGTDRLVLERLEGMSKLSRLLDQQDERVRALFRRTGRAIATVHRDARVTPGLDTVLEVRTSESGERVFIHGDLTTDNVCYQADTDSLVILDWAAAPGLGGLASAGDPMIDVVWFLAHACRAPSARRLALPDPELLDQFVRGYSEVRPSVITRESFDSMRAALTPRYTTELQRAAALRSASSRIGYLVVQRARLRAWLRYEPFASTG